MAAAPVWSLIAFLLLQAPTPAPPAPSHISPEDEADSYAIYSMLLKSELPPQWKINSWSIAEKTATFPRPGTSLSAGLESCLRVTADQESIYRPLFSDYIAKNQNPALLEQKFSLASYVLAGPDLKPKPTLLFEVSAVGFSENHTRALVYVGHSCGGLCGGGQYHLLVKKNGHWTADTQYHGASCVWAA